MDTLTDVKSWTQYNNYRKQLINQIQKELAKKNADFSDTNDMIDPQALLFYAKWTEKPYTRVCLFKNTAFELILICWNPMAQTPIHDHNEQSCRVFFFDGPFQETIYCDKGEKVLHTRNIKLGETTCMDEGKQCHSLKNRSKRKGMTLHLYNEPIKYCRVRKSGKDLPMEKTMLQYDFIVK